MTWGVGGMEPEGDPSRAWDLLCDEEDRDYRARIVGATCGLCARCAEPDDIRWGNPERMGYCEAVREFVGLDDSVEDLGLECFE